MPSALLLVEAEKAAMEYALHRDDAATSDSSKSEQVVYIYSSST